MKCITLGTYQLGWENVQLVAQPQSTGGTFWFCPDDKSPGRIEVGLGYDNWGEVVSALLHEAFEFSFAKFGNRYNHCGKLMSDHSDYLFVFNHPEFAQHCCRVACFITACLPKLAAAYRKCKKH